MSLDYLKEALKLETEKLKIFAAYFAGLFAVMGNILMKGEFSSLYMILLFINLMLLFLVGVVLGSSMMKCTNFLNLLKKEKQ